MGADNYENLGFQVKIDGATDAVNHLQNIIDRLERIQKLQGGKTSKSSSKLLSEEEKYAQRVARSTQLLNSAKYEELRRTELANQQRKKEIDQRLKQELGIKQNTKSLGAYLGKLTAATVIAKKLGHLVVDAVNESAKYIENLNLFAVAFGDTYQESLKWALNTADAYGLASNEVVRFAGTFRELSTSLGLVEETADKVTKTVTNLGYDLSALFNTTVEQAMEKLQSGIFSGNVRPLRAFGIDISQNQIDALFETNEALRQLGVNARNLNQSDKVLARLIITLQSGKDSFGTMAREINNLQSQFRIFQGSLANFKLALGDLVQKPIANVMVYINAFIIAITDIIRAFVPLKTIDETPVGNLGVEAEEASEALDNLNGKLADFDKFNVLGGQSSGSNQISVTEQLNKLLEEQVSLYDDRLTAAMEAATNRATELAKKIRDWFAVFDEEGNFVEWTDPVELLSSALMTLISIKVYNWIFNLISSMKLATGEFNLMSTASNVLAGAGLFLLISNTIDLIKNWDELDGKGKAIRITMIAVGAALTLFATLTKIALKDTTLLTTAFKLQKIAAVGLAVGGIGLLVSNLTNLIGNWDEMSRFEKVVGIFGAIGAAALTAAAAVAAFHGAWTLGTAVTAIVGGLAAITAAFVAFKKDTKVDGFADGGYTNANLIMTHENGKREWVGKAAGSSAIVNDTQMSDIMEVAVAKGVYNALSARSAMGGNVPTNETIVVKIGEEAVFNAVRKTARRQGRDFANV